MYGKIRIDTRFLTYNDHKKFKRKDISVFKRAYNRAIENLKDPSVLPYIPKLYIFPYVMRDRIPISEHEAIQYTSYATQSVDPSDWTRLAIFAPIYLKRLPFKEIVYTLAHEIAHVVQRRGSVDASLADFVSVRSKGMMERKELTEESAIKTYDIFKEPFKNKLIQSDKSLGKYIEKLTEGIKFLNNEDFTKFIMGDNYQEFRKFVGEKLKNLGALSRARSGNQDG